MRLFYSLAFGFIFIGWVSSRTLKTDIKISEQRRVLQESHEIQDDLPNLNEYDDQESLISDISKERSYAVKNIMNKILEALGTDFLENNPKLPNNDSIPIVASTDNIETQLCAEELYVLCSLDTYFSSCEVPKYSNADLWKERFNLFFDLPEDLLKNQLLNATLRFYKNSSLPLNPASKIVFELYVYTRELTRNYDINFLYDSVTVVNGYIGWITFDVTDLLSNMDFSKHHGFLVKVKEAIGVYWNDPYLITPMNCSDSEKNIIPIAVGVITDQPEQKYPSLTLYTGSLHPQYFNDFEEDSLNLSEIEGDYTDEPIKYKHFIDDKPKSYMKEMSTNFSDLDYVLSRDLSKGINEMSGDDPDVKNVHPTTSFTEEPRRFDIEVENEEVVLPGSYSSNLPNQHIKHRYHYQVIKRNPTENQVYHASSIEEIQEVTTRRDLSINSRSSLPTNLKKQTRWPSNILSRNAKKSEKRRKSQLRKRNHHKHVNRTHRHSRRHSKKKHQRKAHRNSHKFNESITSSTKSS